MQDHSTHICPCGCGLPVRPGRRFRQGHHWKALAEERFWAQVDTTGGADGCWPWVGCRSDNGYGTFGINGTIIGSHRHAYVLSLGPIPDGLWVLHHCDNRPCCNPAHLFLGTPKDNTQDALAKGRIVSGDDHWTRRYPEKRPRGERHGCSKLSDAERDTILALWRQGGRSFQDLADKFAVHRNTIFKLCVPKEVRRPRRKVTPEQVADMRAARAAGASVTALAVRYGVSISAASMILSGRRWKTTH